MYRAHRAASPNRAVALKVLDGHHRREDQTARLRREFEFAHQLHHPHVVTVYEYGLGWLTMELLDGGTVTTLVEKGDRLAALAQIGDALDYAHRCGIVHCDVKPSNILVSQDFSRAVLIDFGVAHAVAETFWRRPTHLEASLPYTAPELLHGRPPSSRTDAVRTGMHGGRAAYSVHRHSRPTRQWNWWTPISASLCRATRARSLGCHVFSIRYWAGHWRRSRRVGMTRARSSSRSSPERWGNAPG